MKRVLEFATGKPRYYPKIYWSDKSWTHNVFRFLELLFGRRYGIRCESVVTSHNGVTYRSVYTVEAAIAHIETHVRNWIKDLAFEPVRVYVPQMALPNGVSMPSGYLFAIAYVASGFRREASGGSPNTLSITVSGSDTHLWVNTATDVNDVSSCTYNSVAVGAVSGAQVNGSSNVVTGPQMRVLIAPTAGANNLVTSSTSGEDLAVSAAVYSGCNQTTATDGTPGTYTSASTTTVTVTMTVTTADSWLIGGMTSNQNNFSAGAGTTVRQADPNSSISDSNGTVSTGSQSLVATFTPSGLARGAVCTILPAVAAPSGPTNIKTYNGITASNTKTWNGIDWADIKTFNGIS